MVKGERRKATKYFEPDQIPLAAEFYDLVALYQHGKGAELNFPERELTD